MRLKHSLTKRTNQANSTHLSTCLQRHKEYYLPDLTLLFLVVFFSSHIRICTGLKPDSPEQRLSWEAWVRKLQWLQTKCCHLSSLLGRMFGRLSFWYILGVLVSSLSTANLTDGWPRLLCTRDKDICKCSASSSRCMTSISHRNDDDACCVVVVSIGWRSGGLTSWLVCFVGSFCQLSVAGRQPCVGCWCWEVRAGERQCGPDANLYWLWLVNELRDFLLGKSTSYIPSLKMTK